MSEKCRSRSYGEIRDHHAEGVIVYLFDVDDGHWSFKKISSNNIDVPSDYELKVGDVVTLEASGTGVNQQECLRIGRISANENELDRDFAHLKISEED